MKDYRHVFGPVPSRRLGLSLGVDLIPFKTCSLDCVYCECGRTTDLTGLRKEYVDYNEVSDELKHYLDSLPELDFITFSGSGEPTLNSRIGDITEYLKKNWPDYNLALLTNGTLLYDPEVRRDIQLIDLVKISIDSVTEKGFTTLNRPADGITAEMLQQGIRDFCSETVNRVIFEMFIVPGVNDTQSELQRIKEFLKGVNADRLQLNTLDRPSAESWVKKPEPEKVKKAAEYLSRNLNFDIEIIGGISRRMNKTSFNCDIEKMILSTISRRPMTDKDIASVTGLHINNVNKYLSELIRDNKIISKSMERGVFFEKV